MTHLIGEYRNGRYRKRVVPVTTASTVYDVQSSESGTIFWLNTATTMTFRLPRASSQELGWVFEFAIQEQASSNDVKVTCNAFNSSALIQSAFSSVVDNHTTVIPASTFFTGARLTAVSSIVWMLEQLTIGSGGNISSASSGVSGTAGGWTTG